MTPVVESLFIYPLKSARGIALKEMPIVASGPQYDREWMLVNESNSFLSQRTHPQLSQLEAELTETDLIINSQGRPSLKIPLVRHSAQNISVKIFNHETPAEWLNSQYDKWFSNFLNQKVRLVRSPKEKSRETSGNNGPKTEILFPDGYPLLLTNEATLAELNSKLDSPVAMNRFRPNIVISGIKANEEDSYQSFKIGEVNFLSVKACTRCVIINVEQESGNKNPEVSKTLKEYRNKEGHIIFGNNLSHSNQGTICVGQSLDLTKT